MIRVVLIKPLLGLALTGLLAGCSFHSTQLDLLQSLWASREQGVNLEDIAWTMNWSGRSTTVYPGIDGDRTVFVANPDIAVIFNGWNVTAAQGLLPNDEVVEISESEEGLSYSISDDLIRHACADFAATEENGRTVWRQRCNGSNGEYSNVIEVEAGDIKALTFMIYPGYPQVELTSNN